MAKPKQNLYGQEMGNKGSQTRAKILKATHALIQQRPLRELKVSEIGALAGVSSSTFYLYFQTVSEAALAIAEEANQSNEQILRILEREWTTDNIFDHCRDFVKSYFSFGLTMRQSSDCGTLQQTRVTSALLMLVGDRLNPFTLHSRKNSPMHKLKRASRRNYTHRRLPPYWWPHSSARQ